MVFPVILRRQWSQEMLYGPERNIGTVNPGLTATTINLSPSSLGMLVNVWSI
jgi:hypothetical protein